MNMSSGDSGLLRLGRVLRGGRKRQGLKVIDVADELQLDAGHIVELEAGRCRPTLTTLLRLLLIYDLAPMDIQRQVGQGDPELNSLLRQSMLPYSLYLAVAGSNQ